MRYAKNTVRAAVAAIILSLVTPAAAMAAPSPLVGVSENDRAQAVERPSRGGAGRYGDSNVYAVWKGASHAERSFWECVRNHESRHAGHYDAANPVSTARGAGQWLRGTWQGVIVWVKWRGEFVDRDLSKYPEASDAPAWIQDLAFRHIWKRGGQSMWRGTNCGYGT